MKKFIIERDLPGAGNMTAEELQAVSKTSVSVIAVLGKPYKWVESYGVRKRWGLKCIFLTISVLFSTG